MSSSNPNTLPPRKRHRSSPSLPNGASAEETLEYDDEDVEEEEEEEVVVEEIVEVVEEVVEFEEEIEEDASGGDSDSAAGDVAERSDGNRSGSDDDDDADADRRAKRRKIDYSVEVCRDFSKKTCFRTEIDCKFAHPLPSVAIAGDRVTACVDSLRGACFRGRNCKYYHPPLHIQEQLRQANGMPKPRDRTICKDFLRGRCSRGRDCRYSHSGQGERVVVCQDFLRGKCERRACKYSHGSLLESERFLRLGTPEKSRGSGVRKDERASTPICSDFLNNKCFREYCKYTHPRPQKDSTLRELDDRDICRDFLRGACRRTECRFYHPSGSR